MTQGQKPPHKSGPKQVPKDLSFRKFLALIEKLGLHRRQIGLVLVLQFVSTFFETVSIAFVIPIIQYLDKQEDIATLAQESTLWHYLAEFHAFFGLEVSIVTLMAFCFVSVLVRQVFTYVRMVYLQYLYNYTLFVARTRGFIDALGTRLDYHDKNQSGTIVNDLMLELEQAVACIRKTVSLLGGAVICVIYVAFLTAVSWSIVLIAALAILLAFVGLRRTMSLSRNHSRVLAKSNQEMSNFLFERINALRLIRLTGMQTIEAGNMTNFASRQRNERFRLGVLQARVQAVLEPLFLTFIVGCFAVGHSVLAVPLDRMAIIVGAMIRLFPVIKELISGRQMMLTLMGSLEVVERRLSDMEAAVEAKAGSKPVGELGPGIRFEHVSFRYDEAVEGRAALEDVDFEIESGRMTAIVGPSGSGKSTLIDLLPRLRVPAEGRITLNGIDLAEYDPKSLRAAIAFAPQRPIMFDETVEEHIRRGKPDATQAEIEEAVRQAGATKFIGELPQGYQTRLGERGHRLSGGQMQRLDIARCLIQEAPVLILDEPTSALDPDSEHLFRQTLRRLRDTTGKTIIVIAHRLSTIADADNIVVLNGGKVDAVGSHNTLMQNVNWYASAFSKQNSGFPDMEVAAS